MPQNNEDGRNYMKGRIDVVGYYQRLYENFLVCPQKMQSLGGNGEGTLRGHLANCIHLETDVCM